MAMGKSSIGLLASSNGILLEVLIQELLPKRFETPLTAAR